MFWCIVIVSFCAAYIKIMMRINCLFILAISFKTCYCQFECHSIALLDYRALFSQCAGMSVCVNGTILWLTKYIPYPTSGAASSGGSECESTL